MDYAKMLQYKGLMQNWWTDELVGALILAAFFCGMLLGVAMAWCAVIFTLRHMRQKIERIYAMMQFGLDGYGKE